MFERPLNSVPIERGGPDGRPTSLPYGGHAFSEVISSLQKPEDVGQGSLLEGSVEVLPVPEDN